MQWRAPPEALADLPMSISSMNAQVSASAVVSSGQ
jgi:hypothetical protein